MWLGDENVGAEKLGAAYDRTGAGGAYDRTGAGAKERMGAA